MIPKLKKASVLLSREEQIQKALLTTQQRNKQFSNIPVVSSCRFLKNWG